MHRFNEMMHSFEMYLEDPEESNIHPSDIAYLLKKVRKNRERSDRKVNNRESKNGPPVFIRNVLQC